MKKNTSIVLVGAGKVGTALSKRLYKNGFNFNSIIDLDITKARNLAKKINAKIIFM